MINMLTTDMLTLAVGDVDPATKEMRSVTADVSFQSMVAADASVIEAQIDGLVPLPINAGMQGKPDHFTSQLMFSTGTALFKGMVLPEADAVLPTKKYLLDEEASGLMLPEMVTQNDQAVRPISQGKITLDTQEVRTGGAVSEGEKQPELVITSEIDVPADGQHVIQKIPPPAEGIHQNNAAPTYNRKPNIQTNTPVDPQGVSSTFVTSNPAKQPAFPSQHLWQSGAMLSNQSPSQVVQSQGEIVDLVNDRASSRTTDFDASKGQIRTDKLSSSTLVPHQQAPRVDSPLSTVIEGGLSRDITVTPARFLTSTNSAMPQEKLSDNIAATTAPPIKPETYARNAVGESTSVESATPQPVSPASTTLQPNELAQQPSLRQTQKTNSPKENDQLIENDHSVEASKTNVEGQNSKAQYTTTSQTLPPVQNIEAPQNVAAELTSSPEMMPLETQTIDGPAATRLDTALNRPEVMRHVAQQMASVARQSPDRPVELILNPEELGRVRLTFTTTDGGLNVAVVAERGDTTELLRRHIETLAQEFRELGYKDVSFDFAGNGAGRDQNKTTDETTGQTKTTNQNVSPTDTVAPVQLSLDPSKGLDLRL